ncbi:MAG: NAD(P)H-hydrate dehydratase [Eggerthellaceae bacterium]|nr:NAD(P)H-hydrate dehydratase [Eggerthellaceae bacterium]
MRDYSPRVLAELLPFPQEKDHKYSRGKLVLVGGSSIFPGAAALAVVAAQRAGAGYTEAYVAAQNTDLVRGAALSAVVRPWEDLETAKLPLPKAGKPCAYVLGCGLCTMEKEGPRLLEMLLGFEAPLLLDGGALTFLADSSARERCVARQEKGLTTVMSPHAGEAARLLSILSEDAQAQAAAGPAEAAAVLAQAYGVTCVLKGSDTYISNGVDSYCMSEGTAALAKAGTGDVLAGIIGALLAQGMDSFDACVLGSTLHAHAGNLAAEGFSSIAVIPEDVINYLPQAIKRLSAL